MEYTRKNFRHLVVIFILLLGLAVGLYLVRNPKIFRSRASSKPADNLKVSDSERENIEKLSGEEAAEFGGTENIPVFRTKGSTFTIHYNR